MLCGRPALTGGRSLRVARSIRFDRPSKAQGPLDARIAVATRIVVDAGRVDDRFEMEVLDLAWAFTLNRCRSCNGSSWARAPGRRSRCARTTDLSRRNRSGHLEATAIVSHRCSRRPVRKHVVQWICEPANRAGGPGSPERCGGRGERSACATGRCVETAQTAARRSREPPLSQVGSSGALRRVQARSASDGNLVGWSSQSFGVWFAHGACEEIEGQGIRTGRPARSVGGRSTRRGCSRPARASWRGSRPICSIAQSPLSRGDAGARGSLPGRQGGRADGREPRGLDRAAGDAGRGGVGAVVRVRADARGSRAAQAGAPGRARGQRQWWFCGGEERRRSEILRSSTSRDATPRWRRSCSCAWDRRRVRAQLRRLVRASWRRSVPRAARGPADRLTTLRWHTLNTDVDKKVTKQPFARARTCPLARPAIVDRNSRWGVMVRSRLLGPVSRPSWLTSSMDSARASTVRILGRCEVDNAVSVLQAWKPQLGGSRCRLSIGDLPTRSSSVISSPRDRERVLLGERD
jgi:hypothetical protein